MAKSKTIPDKEPVTAYIQQLDKSTAEVVEALRQIILSTDPEISEEIKWNGPSFYYTGPMQPFNPTEYKRHMIVMNLHNRVLLVWPSGAKANDTSGLLEGDYADGRRLMKITGIAEVMQKEPAIRAVIKAWLKTTRKEYSPN